MIGEKFWDRKIGPMGHPWGTWGLYLKKLSLNEHPNFKFLSFGVYMNPL